MEVEFLAVSLALSIRKPLWIRVDTPVRQFTCKLAGKDSTFLPSFRHVKGCGEGIALWGNTMARKKKNIILHIVIHIDLENTRLLQKKQNEDFRLTWQGAICRIWFKNTSLWKHCSVAVNHNILRVNLLYGQGGRKITSEYNRNLQNLEHCGECGQGPAVNLPFPNNLRAIR